MSIIFNIAYGVHVLSVIAILAMLLSRIKKSPKKLNPGILHAGLLAPLAALVMVGIMPQVEPDETLNHTKLGVKALILSVILTLGYMNVKKDILKNSVWATMLGLTVLNIVIASAW